MDRRAAHEARVDALVAAHLDRRRLGLKHPVEDFLFTYYNHRPNQLRTWYPGFDRAPTEKERARIGWIRDLLAATRDRPPHLGCFGLHEWAMVYRDTETRHPVPLRMGHDELAAFVESQNIRCGHFDAFRFFTPPARSLNLLQPTRDTQRDHEQPGCLHANMDLYKWAYKLAPLVPAELVADCFELARDIRTLDMRASPYDLAGLGYPPVRIETPNGRAEYVTHQRAFAERAAPLRDRLVDACDRLLAAATVGGPAAI
ncbi:3-methyladenine DNA glycosylase [Longispora urticae]